MGGSPKRPTLADYNAVMTARAERYRTQARLLRELAGTETANFAMLRHELLQIAEDYEALAESIERLRFRDD